MRKFVEEFPKMHPTALTKKKANVSRETFVNSNHHLKCCRRIYNPPVPSPAGKVLSIAKRMRVCPYFSCFAKKSTQRRQGRSGRGKYRF